MSDRANLAILEKTHQLFLVYSPVNYSSSPRDFNAVHNDSGILAKGAVTK